MDLLKNFSKEYCAEVIETEPKHTVNMKKKVSAQKVGDSRGATIWIQLWDWVVVMVADNEYEEGFITTLNTRQLDLDRCTRSACLYLAAIGICV